jgi:EAL domain-containing protein (putative c-di-GMP-specific phosphodiesterase class I)/GGDEF domain-containing protein
VDSDFDAEIAAEFQLFADQTADFVGVADPWGRILYLNPAARKRLGVADAVDLTVADVFPAEAFAVYHEVVRPQLLRTGAWSGEIPVIVAGRDPITMYVSTTARIGPGGEINETVVYAHELSHVDPVRGTHALTVGAAAEVLEQSAFHDRVDDALALAAGERENCALVLATLNMDDTIETYDVHVVANVMRAVAGRITRFARAIDIVGQLGEHQLGLFLRGVRSHGEALRIARTVAEALVTAPVTIPGGEIALSVAYGVAVSNPGDDLEHLAQRAAATMRHEPSARDDAAINTSQPITDGSDTSPNMDEFRVAMTCGDIRAYAQPIVDLVSGRLVGYRGLARWHHRHLGLLKAAAFVDMIAETPLVNQVDLYVARETAAALMLTTRHGERPCLYTPVSRRLIGDVRTEQYLSEIADAFYLTMGQLRLQIARPLLDQRILSFHDALRSLRDVGTTLVLTDAEIVSDAQHLAELGFQELHLSRRLTNAAATDSSARDTATELARRAHGLGLRVGATGVNDEEHRAVLLDIGCDLATGDLYGAAKPADTIE